MNGLLNQKFFRLLSEPSQVSILCGLEVFMSEHFGNALDRNAI